MLWCGVVWCVMWCSLWSAPCFQSLGPLYRNPASSLPLGRPSQTKLDKAERDLGYKPMVSMKEGLRKYIASVRSGKTFPGTTPAFYRDAVTQSLMLRLYQVPLDVHRAIPRSPRILIIGAGVCGICAALRLQELGHTNYEILEVRVPRAAAVPSPSLLSPFPVCPAESQALWG